MSDRIWTLAPADLGTLWEECRRCFYLGVGAGFPRPAAGADAGLDLLVSALGGRRTEGVAAGMARGVLETGHRSVQSQPRSSSCRRRPLRVMAGERDWHLAVDAVRA